MGKVLKLHKLHFLKIRFKLHKCIKMKTWMVAIPVDVSWARAPEKTSRAVALIWKYLGFPMTFLSFGQSVSNSECITRELNPEAFLLRVGIKTPLFG